MTTDTDLTIQGELVVDDGAHAQIGAAGARTMIQGELVVDGVALDSQKLAACCAVAKETPCATPGYVLATRGGQCTLPPSPSCMYGSPRWSDSHWICVANGGTSERAFGVTTNTAQVSSIQR